MVGSQDALAVGDDVAVEVGGLPVLPEMVQRVGDVVAAAEGLGVVGPEDALAVGEGLSVEVGGLLVFSEPVQCVGEVVASA